ncbi:hypothetical protein G3V89_23165, partial [Escherichia coli]|nr:hypothetical protein [Escherichia coli]
MVTDEERRRVAARLRRLNAPSMIALMSILDVSGRDMCTRLADLIEPEDEPYNLFSLYEAVFQRTPRDGFVIEDDEVEDLVDALMDMCNAPGHEHIARAGESGVIDRDALLELADEMQRELDECESDHEIAGKLENQIRRIREALGEGES